MSDSGNSDEEEEIIVRRIDKRLAKRDESDLPWLRRIVGAAIIVGAFWYGWTTMNRKSDEIIKKAKQEAARAANSPLQEPVSSDVASAPTAIIPPTFVPQATIFLNPESLTTISECTKGVNAFRAIDLKGSTSGEASLESVFRPILIAEKGRARRSIQLQNIRLRTKSGEELRLHAAPKNGSGDLYLSLFRVAGDGLPEEIPFPPELLELKDRKIDDMAVAKFLSLSETPGRALAMERHESWSFSEKVGLQTISSDDQIYDLQVFMPNRFLACSRGVRAGEPTVHCKCVERGKRP